MAGRVREDGSSDVVLLSGAIAVNTPDTDVAVDIFTSGWGMNISPTGFASDPVQFSTDQINDIVAAVEFEAPEAALESFVEAAANVAEGNAGQNRLRLKKSKRPSKKPQHFQKLLKSSP